jgi:hypothetical protein
MLFRTTVLGLTLAGTIATPAFAAEDLLCAKLDGLIVRAREGQVVRVSFSNALGGDIITACGPTDAPDQKIFCDELVASSGMHGLHTYPRRVRDCLLAARIRPYTATRRTLERPILTRIGAILPDQVRLDLTYVPEPPSDEDTWYFYGRYELVLWKP